MLRTARRSIRISAVAVMTALVGSIPSMASSYRRTNVTAGAYHATSAPTGTSYATSGAVSPTGPMVRTGSADTGLGWHESNSAKRQFQKKTGYPDGRPGYVVDYIVPLRRGGADSPDNMQWLTIDQARARAGAR